MKARDSVAATVHSKPTRRILQTIALTFIGLVLIGLFIYFDRRDQVSLMLRNWGIWGVIGSIVLMTVLCAVPVPSEFLLILDMRVYGVWWGIFYAWVGSILGAAAILIVTRWIARPFLDSMFRHERYEQVNEWVRTRGPLGLLMARLLPLPASVVNYIAGLVHSVGPWNYIWTAAVSIIPYYLGAALIYLGIFSKFVVWLFVGGLVVVTFWIASFLVNRRMQR